MFIDTHAHVQFSGFKDEADEVMRRALDSDVGVVNVGTQIDTSREAVQMLDRYPKNVWAVVGLHPEHTYQHMVDEEESHFMSREEAFDYGTYKVLAQNPRVVGIGECGLDYYRFTSEMDTENIKQRQKDAFELQIKLAIEMDKALCVHCRPTKNTVDAYDDVLEIVSRYKLQNPDLRFEIHCFTGTLEIAHKFVALGGYIGLNGIITFDKTGKSEAVVKNISLEHIILETDCPYLTPVPHRGKRNEPALVKHVAEKIAELKQISYETVAEQTTANAKSLFKI